MDWNIILDKIKSPVLWLGILGALKYFLQMGGITISDTQLNAMANGAAAVVMVISMFMDHSKKPSAQPSVSQQPTNTVL